ncbi:MAG TPA: amino acid-binding protein [Candidatus Dormibacteraeota bacterium]
MPMQTDFEIALANRPGAAAEVGEALGTAGVNIDGMCAHASGGGEGVMHLLVSDDPASARAALEGLGVEIANERRVFVISCPDRPGELGRLLRRVAAADLNLVILYLTTQGRLVIGAEDIESVTGLLS